MTTPSEIQDFEPIQYNPEITARRAAPSERQSHRLQPYARSGSLHEGTLHSESSSIASGSFVSSDPGKRKAKKMSLGDLPQNDRPAVKWARKRLLMDLLTTVLWSQNESEEDKDTYLNEVLNQANKKFGTHLELSKDITSLITQSLTQFRSSLIELVDRFVNEFMIKPAGVMAKESRVAYMINRRSILLDASEDNRWRYFLHGKVFNSLSHSDKLLVFGNGTLQKILLLHVYASTYTPLRDEKFLAELSTATSYMLSHVAVGVECGIDKVVEEESSGRSVRFLGERYAPRQLSYFNAIEDAFKLEVHREELPARLLDLHNRGVQALRAKSGLLPPERLIYVPDTMEQLVRPHEEDEAAGTSSGLFSQSSSAGAVLQMPVHGSEAPLYPQYLTGDIPTRSSMVVHSQADAGPAYNDFDRFEPEDQDDTNNVALWDGGYSLY